MVKFTDFISQKMIYWCVIVLLLSDMATGSFLNKWKNKTNKDVLKKWAPDLYGAVDINLPKIVNTDINDILTNPTKNYIRAVLKRHNVCHALIMDTILAYVGKNPFLLHFLIGEPLTNDNNISFSPDYLYMVTRSKTIKVWLLQRGLCVRTLKQKNESRMANSVRIATNGEFIVFSAKFRIHVWFPKEEQVHEIDSYLKIAHESTIIDEETKALAISSDNFLVGSVSNGGSRVSVWDIKNKHVSLKWCTWHKNEPSPTFGPACEFFCNNSLLCAAQIEKKIFIFSVADGTLLYQMWTKNFSPYIFFILLPEKNQLFVGSESRHLFFLDLKEGVDVKVREVALLLRTKVGSMDFDMTNNDIAICNTIKTIFLKMEKSIGTIFESDWTARMRTLSPSGKYCALYDDKRKAIKIVNVDDFIVSFLNYRHKVILAKWVILANF